MCLLFHQYRAHRKWLLLKLNVLFCKVTHFLMRTHFEATLMRQNSKGSRCSNTFNIQSSRWSKCLKSELGYCIIKIDEVQAEKPYKEALYSISRQTSCDVFLGSRCSEARYSLFSFHCERV